MLVATGGSQSWTVDEADPLGRGGGIGLTVLGTATGAIGAAFTASEVSDGKDVAQPVLIPAVLGGAAAIGGVILMVVSGGSAERADAADSSQIVTVQPVLSPAAAGIAGTF